MATTRPDHLYRSDYYAWTRDQADALRRLAAERWNGPLDLANLAEEVRGAQGPEVEPMVDWLTAWVQPIFETTRDHARG